MSSLRVLLVEDDLMIGVVLSELITGMGHEVCAVETTEAGAVAAAARYKPDFMIVDVRLGTESGLSAVQKILHYGSVPYILMSGAEVIGSSPGAVILQKPFREWELILAMEHALMPKNDT